MLDGLLCILIKIINMLFAVIFSWWVDLLIFLLAFLPPSPIKFEPIKWGEFGNIVGYFIPVEKMATHFATILMALAVWYAIQHVLRIVRMVR